MKYLNTLLMKYLNTFLMKYLNTLIAVAEGWKTQLRPLTPVKEVNAQTFPTILFPFLEV